MHGGVKSRGGNRVRAQGRIRLNLIRKCPSSSVILGQAYLLKVST